MKNLTFTLLTLLLTLASCLSAGADDRYERRSIPDWAARSRRSNPPPPPAVGVHRSQPPPPVVHRRQPPPPAEGIHRRDVPDPPHYHTSGGMLIERAGPQIAHPGETIVIEGIRFGQHPGTKIVAINMGHVNRMQVLRWSDHQIRARIPRDLGPGNYRLLIYYDDTFRTSSNSLGVRIR